MKYLNSNIILLSSTYFVWGNFVRFIRTIGMRVAQYDLQRAFG